MVFLKSENILSNHSQTPICGVVRIDGQIPERLSGCQGFTVRVTPQKVLSQYF